MTGPAPPVQDPPPPWQRLPVRPVGGLFAVGWSMQVHAPAWPSHSVMLAPARAHEGLCIGDDGACELRACGFSETGLGFVIATSCDLTLFVRPAASDASG